MEVTYSPHHKSSASEANRTDYPAGQDPARWRVLIIVLVTVFMSLISVSIVNVALPSIQSGLGATDSDVQWVLSGYALTFGVVLVAAGRAGDLVGRGASSCSASPSTPSVPPWRVSRRMRIL